MSGTCLRSRRPIGVPECKDRVIGGTAFFFFSLSFSPSPWCLLLRPAAASTITYPAPRLPSYPEQVLVRGVDDMVHSSLSEGSLGNSVAGRAAPVDNRHPRAPETTW